MFHRTRLGKQAPRSVSDVNPMLAKDAPTSRWRNWGRSGLLVLGLTIAVLGAEALLAPPREISSFVEAIGHRRLIEPRVTGGFYAGPIRVAARRASEASLQPTLSDDAVAENWLAVIA